MWSGSTVFPMPDRMRICWPWCYRVRVFLDGGETRVVVKLWITSILLVVTSLSALGAEKLTYEPLSAETGKLGRLEKYTAIEKTAASVQLGDLGLAVRVPARGEAYDAVPIEFSVAGSTGPDQRVAVEVTAFEDEAQRKGRDLYDLAMPGSMKLKIEYLGSQTGIFDPKRVTRLTATSKHETFPPYTLEPFVRSGTVKRGNYLFFKFRITNVGDTVLDAEGFGGWMAWPQAVREADPGGKEAVYETVNMFERNLQYVYPGESFEQWVHFWSPIPDPSRCRTLPVGKYKIRWRACYRWNTEYDWGANMWAGRPWIGLEVPIEVTETGGKSSVLEKELELEAGNADRMTRYVGSLEEFMTSFKVFEKSELASGPAKGTIHLQVAPWTKQVVVKLIGNTPGRIKTAAVPIAVSTDNLAIRRNPDNPFVVTRGGKRVPAFCTQDMSAMRTTIQLGPNPERHLPARLKEMLDCGVNLICSTAGNWHIPEIVNSSGFFGDAHAETFKYYYDVLVPRFRVRITGWGIFPCRTPNVQAIGSFYWGRKFDVPSTGDHYAYSGRGDLDVGHPDYPALQAGAILFNYARWGKHWYRTADGDVLIDVEDTWGWLRDDINVRFFLGEHAMTRWRVWLRNKYRTIGDANQAWGTSYKSFDEVDPQANQGNEGKAYGADLSRMAPVYNRKENPFHDWSPAVADWDVFRTELRCDVYEQILKLVREKIPRAQINIRTEGGFVPVQIPPDSQDAHLRHSFYAQRRQALVAEVLARRKVFKYHSDYTTIPYTESEWRYLLQQLSKQGMRGNYLPQFCTARDMVLNDRWGRDFQMNYNLDKPTKAIMMHVLQAAYPVWRVTYEEGHCPGVLWEDYQCDGFVTETQKRELKLFREHLNKMKP